MGDVQSMGMCLMSQSHKVTVTNQAVRRAVLFVKPKQYIRRG